MPSKKNQHSIEDYASSDSDLSTEYLDAIDDCTRDVEDPELIAVNSPRLKSALKDFSIVLEDEDDPGHCSEFTDSEIDLIDLASSDDEAEDSSSENIEDDDPLNGCKKTYDDATEKRRIDNLFKKLGVDTCQEKKPSTPEKFLKNLPCEPVEMNPESKVGAETNNADPSSILNEEITRKVQNQIAKLAQGIVNTEDVRAQTTKDVGSDGLKYAPRLDSMALAPKKAVTDYKPKIAANEQKAVVPDDPKVIKLADRPVSALKATSSAARFGGYAGNPANFCNVNAGYGGNLAGHNNAYANISNHGASPTNYVGIQAPVTGNSVVHRGNYDNPHWGINSHSGHYGHHGGYIRNNPGYHGVDAGYAHQQQQYAGYARYQQHVGYPRYPVGYGGHFLPPFWYIQGPGIRFDGRLGSSSVASRQSMCNGNAQSRRNDNNRGVNDAKQPVQDPKNNSELEAKIKDQIEAKNEVKENLHNASNQVEIISIDKLNTPPPGFNPPQATKSSNRNIAINSLSALVERKAQLESKTEKPCPNPSKDASHQSLKELDSSIVSISSPFVKPPPLIKPVGRPRPLPFPLNHKDSVFPSLMPRQTIATKNDRVVTLGPGYHPKYQIFTQQEIKISDNRTLEDVYNNRLMQGYRTTFEELKCSYPEEEDTAPGSNKLTLSLFDKLVDRVQKENPPTATPYGPDLVAVLEKQCHSGSEPKIRDRLFDKITSPAIMWPICQVLDLKNLAAIEYPRLVHSVKTLTGKQTRLLVDSLRAIQSGALQNIKHKDKLDRLPWVKQIYQGIEERELPSGFFNFNMSHEVMKHCLGSGMVEAL